MAEKPSNKSKRLVKNPDTFRERAQKATVASDKPSKAGKTKTAIAKPFSPVGRAVVNSLLWRAIGKVFKGVGRVLNFVTRSYFSNSWRELRLVTWPNWKQSRQLTGAVLIFAIVFGATIALVDFGLDKLFKKLILKH